MFGCVIVYAEYGSVSAVYTQTDHGRYQRWHPQSSFFPGFGEKNSIVAAYIISTE